MVTSTVEERRESAKPVPWRLKVTFWLDAALLASVCVLQTVSFTGLILHEWLGLAIVAMVFAHLLFSWSWIASQSRRVFSSRSIRVRVNYVLNLSLFACVTAVIFSGVLISQKAVPTLTGANGVPEMDWRWDTLHNQFSNYLIILAAFHLALNWDWLVAAAERVFSRVRKGAL
jgi:hypothetical protein